MLVYVLGRDGLVAHKTYKDFGLIMRIEGEREESYRVNNQEKNLKYSKKIGK